MICIVAGEPTNLIAESNSTHVTVSWKSPGDHVTGYVIYYQSKGGGNSSDIVYGETESHSLDCLENRVIYYISIVALSLHLPSPLVGPVTVISGVGKSLNSHVSHWFIHSISPVHFTVHNETICTTTTTNVISVTSSTLSTTEPSDSGMNFIKPTLSSHFSFSSSHTTPTNKASHGVVSSIPSNYPPGIVCI